MPDLRDYRVINERLVRSLSLQLGLPIDSEDTTESGLSVNAGPLVSGGFKRSSRQPPMKADDPRLLDLVVEGLRDAKQLRSFRPDRVHELGDPGRTYIHEVVVATPVRLPTGPPNEAAQPDNYFTVWVAEPTPPVAPRETEWDFASSYLFLVEDISDISTGPMMFSGISALRFVVIAAMSMGDDTHTLGELFLDARREEDKFGRWFHDDPVEKLVGIGGVPSRPREIESVYKIAYMSDEQSYTTETGQERVCDIFAYPLYIAE